MQKNNEDHPYKTLLKASYQLAKGVNDFELDNLEKHKAYCQLSLTFLHSFLEFSGFLMKSLKRHGAPIEVISEVENLNDRHFLCLHKEIQDFRESYESYVPKDNEDEEDEQENLDVTVTEEKLKLYKGEE